MKEVRVQVLGVKFSGLGFRVLSNSSIGLQSLRTRTAAARTWPEAPEDIRHGGE